MNINNAVQCALFLAVLVALAKPLGAYMARVYEGTPMWADKIFGPIERLIYRLSGVNTEEMGWKTYAAATIAFNVAGIFAVYSIQRLQHLLPINPMTMGQVTADSSFNTAVSFATNTNWQGYGGESTMSYLTQMAALTVQNFLSAATGMAVVIALIRGLVRRQAESIGNFWVDMVRSCVYILLPLSIVVGLALTSQGVVQTFKPGRTVQLLQPTKDSNGKAVTEQTLAMGLAASQIAIKQLGTNGGGYFNANSAHPYENSTPLSNFIELLSLTVIGAALCISFGAMVKDSRQGGALLAAMLVLFIPLTWFCVAQEQGGNPQLAKLGVDQTASLLQPGGNMEGKEVRFGIVNSALWATATTATSCGAVNAMHDSFTPLGGLVPMVMMKLGEVVFGGVGSGLYGILVFVVIAVFISGLMVGRTPEYLGKKIEAYEVKMASIAMLVMSMFVLVGTAMAVVTKPGLAGILNPGAHGFSEILYAFASAGNNNGSAFAGLSANTPFYNTILAVVMFACRYWVIIPVLAMAGSLAGKKIVPASVGTLPTHTPLFIFFLVSVIIIVGALTFFPALSLGPIVEHLMMITG